MALSAQWGYIMPQKLHKVSVTEATAVGNSPCTQSKETQNKAKLNIQGKATKAKTYQSNKKNTIMKLKYGMFKYI